MAVTIVHKNSATSGLEPTNTQLVAGELGVNYNAASPFLTLVDSNNVVRRIAGVWVSATSPTTPTPGEFWLDTSISPASLKVYKDTTDGWVVSTSLAGYLPLTGGTLTGPITVPSFICVNTGAGSANTRQVTFANGIGDQNFKIAAWTGVSTNNSGDVLGSLGLSYTTTRNSFINFHRGSSTTGGFMSFTVNNDSEAARIDSSGRLLLGGSSALTSSSIQPIVQQIGTTLSAATELKVCFNTDTTSGGTIYLAKSKNNTATIGGGTGLVSVNDRLGVLRFMGDDGSILQPGAQIEAFVDGTPGANDMPGRLVFSTTADGAPSSSQRMVINKDGFVGIGVTAPACMLQMASSTSTGLTAGFTLDNTESGSGIALAAGGSAFSQTGWPTLTDVAIVRAAGGSSGGLALQAGATAPITFWGPTTEWGRFDTSGRFLLGTNSTSALNTLLLQGNSSSATGASFIKLARGTSTPGANDILGIIEFSDSGHVNAAIIRSDRDVGTWTSGASQPSRLTFFTTADGSASPTERVRITSAGRVGIGSTGPERALHVAGEATFINNTQFLIAPTTDNVRLYARDAASGAQNLTFNIGSTEAARIDTSARFLVGLSTANSTYTLTSGFTGETPHTQISSSARATMSLVRTNGPGTLVLASGSTAANASPVGTLLFNISDGTNIIPAAFIGVSVDAEPGTNDMPGRMVFATTSDTAASPAERLRIDRNGFASYTGSIGRGAPVTKTGSFTLGNTENWLICNGTGTITVTLPTASAWTGREIMIKTIAAFTVVSASSNVVPLAGGAAGTAILAATAGKYATLVSDGTNWIIMQAN